MAPFSSLAAVAPAPEDVGEPDLVTSFDPATSVLDDAQPAPPAPATDEDAPPPPTGEGAPPPRSSCATDDGRSPSRTMSTTWAAAVRRLAVERHRAAKMSVVALVLFLTAAMSVAEFDSPTRLGAAFLAVGVIFVVVELLDSGVAVAALVFVGLLILCAGMIWAVGFVNALEAFAEKFKQAGDALTRGRSGDALGPASLKPGAVPRQALGADLDGVLMPRAWSLLPGFKGRVIQPLAAFGEVKCGVKGRARALEKSSIDYGGDDARLTDLLRGCCICRDMDGVLGCVGVLSELVRRGVLVVVEIKNRFRSGATATGYMDMNYRFLYDGFMVEVQILVESLYALKCAQTPVYI